MPTNGLVGRQVHLFVEGLTLRFATMFTICFELCSPANVTIVSYIASFGHLCARLSKQCQSNGTLSECLFFFVFESLMSVLLLV